MSHGSQNDRVSRRWGRSSERGRRLSIRLLRLYLRTTGKTEKVIPPMTAQDVHPWVKLIGVVADDLL